MDKQEAIEKVITALENYNKGRISGHNFATIVDQALPTIVAFESEPSDNRYLALEIARDDFYHIHKHPETAHEDSYKFMRKVIAALQKSKPDKCKTCGGSGEILQKPKITDLGKGGIRWDARPKPCPDCQCKCFWEHPNIDPDCPTHGQKSKPAAEPFESNAGFWGRTCARLVKKNNELQTTIDRQVAEIEENRWIPVSERLPEEREDNVPFRSEDVLVTNGISARTAYWMSRQKYWRFDGIGWSNPITHWKPIILPRAGVKETTDS